MNIIYPRRGGKTSPSSASGLVTTEMVRTRTRELARCAGRNATHVTQTDYEQAKRELTGETDPDRQEAMIDSRPVPSCWLLFDSNFPLARSEMPTGGA